MQPILAESVPHRGRGLLFAAALIVAVSLCLLIARRCPTRHRHSYRQTSQISQTKLVKQKQMKHIGKCAHPSYVFIAH